MGLSIYSTDLSSLKCLLRKCIMNTEFVIDINGSKASVYMQTGFFNHKDMAFPLHKHPMDEIHILLSGTAVLKCNKGEIALKEGDVLYVPASMLHTYQSFEKASKRMTFFIDCENHSQTVSKITFPQVVFSLLCKEIEEYVLKGKDGKLKPLLSYICSDFFVEEAKKALSPITNRELIIDDFFTGRYNSNVTLNDLSRELMLSNKQTERVVKKITGNTFSGELAKRRMDAAVVLTQTTKLPLAKISELVGYSSYSGFYKAYKRALKNSSGLSGK